jgi:hypothetical protein
MDKAKQNSIIDAVNSIVNQKEQCKECEMMNRVETALELFEQLFQLELTEEQEEQLIEIGFTDLFEGKKAKQVNLEEDVQTIINEHSPQEVFSYLVELAPLAAAAGGIARFGAMAGRLASRAGGKAVNALGTLSSLTGGGAGPQAASNGVTDGTADAWGQMATLRDRAMMMFQQPTPVGQENTDQIQPQIGEDGRRESLRPSSRERARRLAQQIRELEKRGEYVPISQPQERVIIVDPRTGRQSIYGRENIREDVDTKPIKKKKKVFKIIFIDKGVKKKGTAVSHKGVMRIVSGKSSFKVFDEKNNDVTSQFKHGKKHTKKNEK